MTKIKRTAVYTCKTVHVTDYNIFEAIQRRAQRSFYDGFFLFFFILHQWHMHNLPCVHQQNETNFKPDYRIIKTFGFDAGVILNDFFNGKYLVNIKNIDAAPKSDAGGDEKHVIYFTWPNQLDGNLQIKLEVLCFSLF